MEAYSYDKLLIQLWHVTLQFLNFLNCQVVEMQNNISIQMSLQLVTDNMCTPKCFKFINNLGEAMSVAVQPAEEVTMKKKPHTKQRRVVVTGMGVVSPLGHDPDVFYNNLLEGNSGISMIETFDCTNYPTVNVN